MLSRVQDKNVGFYTRAIGEATFLNVLMVRVLMVYALIYHALFC